MLNLSALVNSLSTLTNGDWLPWAGKTLSGKLLDRLPELIRKKKLDFRKVRGTYLYSHYKGQNHVRQGGQTMIYSTHFSLTVFNPSKYTRAIRELTLICTINESPYRFHLYDIKEQTWKEDYNLSPNIVTTFSWICVPEGHGILPGDPGILHFDLSDEIFFHFTYLNERGRTCRIPIGSLERRRLNPELIGA